MINGDYRDDYVMIKSRYDETFDATMFYPIKPMDRKAFLSEVEKLVKESGLSYVDFQRRYSEHDRLI
jgi:hypothetical protein